MIDFGIPVSCQPATGGTAEINGCAVRPRRDRNLSTERSSATRSLGRADADPFALTQQKRHDIRARQHGDRGIVATADAAGERNELRGARVRRLGQPPGQQLPPVVAFDPKDLVGQT